MKLRQIILARSIRQVAVVGTGVPRIDVIHKIKDRYKFLKAPERYEEIFPNPLETQGAQGIIFQGGRITVDKREVGIDRFQFLPGLIVADTHSSTDDCDLIIDDHIALSNADHPEAITPTGPSYYLSQVELSLERVPDLLPQYEDAAKTIDRFLSDYGHSFPKFGFWGIHLNTDPHHLGVLPPATFALERRLGFPFGAKVFFSQAPLRTKDHIAVLEKLDSAVH